MTRRQIAFASLLALIALLIDQWVKQLVQTNLPLHERVDLIPYLSLYHSHNTGVAFSMLSGVGGTWLSILDARRSGLHPLSRAQDACASEAGAVRLRVDCRWGARQPG